MNNAKPHGRNLVGINKVAHYITQRMILLCTLHHLMHCVWHNGPVLSLLLANLLGPVINSPLSRFSGGSRPNHICPRNILTNGIGL